MRGALFALRILARKYEFKDEEERGPLAPIVAGFLPPLLQILQVGPLCGGSGFGLGSGAIREAGAAGHTVGVVGHAKMRSGGRWRQLPQGLIVAAAYVAGEPRLTNASSLPTA